jgi:CHAT domain-containing protein
MVKVGAAAFVALTLLAGGTAVAAPATPVGMRDLNGEACRATPRTDIAPDPAAPAPVYLVCGEGSSRPSGSVSAIVLPLTLPADVTARRAEIARTAAEAPAGRDTASRMACRAGTWTKTADGIDLLVQSCAMVDGDWPQVHVVAPLGRFLVQADGLPSLLPALEAEMADLAGYRPSTAALAFGGADEARRDLEAAFGNKLKISGGASFNRYGDLVEQARLYSSRMNFPAAEKAYREALDIQERAFGPETIGVATTLLNLGLVVSNQGRFEEAAGLFRRADPIIQASDSPIYRARNFVYLGFDAANRDKFADALRYAQSAAAMWRDLMTSKTPAIEQLGGGTNEARDALRGELAHTLNLAAAMAWRVNDVAYAEASAKEALGIISEQPDLPPWWGPDVLMTLGDILAREGRLREAEESLRGALIFDQRLFGNSAPTAMALLSIGRVYAADKLYEESLRAFTFALDIIAKDDTARALLTYDHLAPLVAIDNALGAQNPSRRAEIDAVLFRALQYMAASVTDQTIARASARLAARDPAIEKLVSNLEDSERKRDNARLLLAYESSLPQAQRGADREQALLRQVNEESGRHDALEAQIRKDFPAYFRLASPEPAALPALQKRLGPREALVEFEFGRDHAAVILVTAHGFTAKPIQSDRNQIAATVRGIRRTLDARAGRISEFDVTDSYKLYRTLFGPVEAQLAGIDSLIVVPDQALASLPIALLVTQAPSGSRDYAHAAWLVRRYADSVVPSVRAFATLRDTAANTRATRPFLGIGNPNFTGKTGTGRGRTGLDALASHCGGDGPIPPELLRALAPLPETAGELRDVAQTLGAGAGDILTGSGATEAAFRREPLDQFRVIYFATHGLLPGELNCQTQPALALSPPAVPATSRSEDGLLDAGEIAGLRLNADLVVLSACNTAESGTKFGGEALSGVAQAFFFAGARTLIASHWQVPSASTVALMVGMFQRLGGGGGTAEALRQSQLALISRPATANPFYWAAFTVLGDGDRGGQAATPKSRQTSLSPREMQR